MLLVDAMGVRLGDTGGTEGVCLGKALEVLPEVLGPRERNVACGQEDSAPWRGHPGAGRSKVPGDPVSPCEEVFRCPCRVIPASTCPIF